MCITSKCATPDYHVERCPPTDGKSVSLYPVILARFTFFRMCISTYEECASLVSAPHPTTMLRGVHLPTGKVYHFIPSYSLVSRSSECASLPTTYAHHYQSRHTRLPC